MSDIAITSSFSDDEIYDESAFEDSYLAVTVTESQFNSNPESFYVKNAGADITKASSKIRFKYYVDDIVTWIDTLPILYDGIDGQKGEDGKQGGAYYGLIQPTSPVEGDFYLDSDEGALYYYENGEWKEDTTAGSGQSFRWNMAANDCFSVADAGSKIIKARNAWVGNLLVNSEFVNDLFANILTLKNGGLFKTENYLDSNGNQAYKTDDEGNSVLNFNAVNGAGIDTYGNADFMRNTHIGGNLTVDGNTTLSNAKIEAGFFNKPVGHPFFCKKTIRTSFTKGFEVEYKFLLSLYESDDYHYLFQDNTRESLQYYSCNLKIAFCNKDGENTFFVTGNYIRFYYSETSKRMSMYVLTNDTSFAYDEFSCQFYYSEEDEIYICFDTSNNNDRKYYNYFYLYLL